MRGFHRHGRNVEKFAAMFGSGGGHGRNGPFGPDGGYGRSGSDGPFGGGRRRGKRFTSDELRDLVLGLLAEDEPQHGYQLIKTIADQSRGVYTPSPGVLYPLLTMLADMGLVAEVEGSEGARRSYALTDVGRTEVETRHAEIAAVLAKLIALGAEAESDDGHGGHAVMRAVKSLQMAAMHASRRAAGNSEKAFAIVDVLDEATRRIERL
jgi:DNA-binding PadR family transcriptional regulator